MAIAPSDLHLKLIAAVQANDLPVASELILAGAMVNRRGPLPMTPLHIAAGRGYVQMVDKLLAAGADVHTLDSSMGASALHFAAQSGVTDVAQLLLDAGAFINLQSATVGLTPLINAIWAKQVGMVHFLLERGAATEIRTHLGGATAWDFIGDGVLWTAGFTNPEQEAWGREIRALLEARKRQDEATLAGQKLMTAVQSGDVGTVRTLIAQGVDVNEKSPVVANGNDGQTALLVASFLGHTEIVRLLLSAGANPRINDYLLKATPVHKAAYAGRPGALLALRENGQGEINAQGPYNGYTAMHDAVWHGHPECLEVILDWPGARFDLVGFDGLTPEGLASRLGYTEMAEMIRARQAALAGSPDTAPV
ncbi:MAG TPA: ankyrin repeat domain-containing protein [Acetobacteraceae bacterium]|nr:ankyrin repeat domain-containing protein [Acetobacteraceae bacterium]